jgi:hypothetical protein
MSETVALLAASGAAPPPPSAAAACPLLAALRDARALCFQRTSYLAERRDMALRAPGYSCRQQQELDYTIFRFQAGGAAEGAGEGWWDNAAEHRGAEPLLRLVETSSPSSRLCWGAQRPFSMVLSFAPGATDLPHPPTITIERPLRLGLLCLSRDELTVRHSALGLLGSAHQPLALGLALQLREGGGGGSGSAPPWLGLRLGLGEVLRQTCCCTCRRARLRLLDASGQLASEVVSVLVKRERTSDGRKNFGENWDVERGLGDLVDWQPLDGLGVWGTVAGLPEAASGAQRAVLVAGVVLAQLAWLDAGRHWNKCSVWGTVWRLAGVVGVVVVAVLVGRALGLK